MHTETSHRQFVDPTRLNRLFGPPDQARKMSQHVVNWFYFRPKQSINSGRGSSKGGGGIVEKFGWGSKNNKYAFLLYIMCLTSSFRIRCLGTAVGVIRRAVDLFLLYSWTANNIRNLCVLTFISV